MSGKSHPRRAPARTGTGAAALVLTVPPERTPRDIERLVCAATANSPVDQIAAAIDAADWLLARAKTIHSLMQEVAIGWIEKNGPFDVGPIRYSSGYSTITKCVNVPGAGTAILAAVGGDLATFYSLLVAQPFKPASVRSVLDQPIYRSLFATRRTGKLICGVPPRVLKREDKRFIGTHRP
jgi:hypothetical protein